VNVVTVKFKIVNILQICLNIADGLLQ